MQIKQLVFLGFACLVAAEGHKDKGNKTENAMGNHMKNGTGHGNSEKRQCSEIAHLTELMDLVNNATRLAAFETKHKLNQTEVDKLKAKAATEETKLKTLSSNSTLMNECAAVNAERKLQSQCRQMKKLTKLINLANNATAMKEHESKHNLTAAEMTKFMDRAKNASTKLTELKSNSTLVSACAGLKDGKSSSSAGIISDASKNASPRGASSIGVFQLVCSSIFAAVAAALLAGLQI